MKISAACLILFGSFVVAPLSGAAEKSDAKAPIAELGEAYVEAFNQGDAKAVAAFWAPDGDYVDASGNHFSGRNAIEGLFTAFFAENKGAQLRVDSESLRLLPGDIAIEDGTTSVFPGGGGPPSRARYTNTLVRKDGRWLLAGVRESAFVPPDRSKELAPLAWLIGERRATASTGETLAISVAPAPGGNFLLSRREVTEAGAPMSGGEEWIAWDPAKKQIRSWSFEADGGFGESVWTPAASGWTVESKYTLRDGGQLREIQWIGPDGKGGVFVKSQGLSVNGADLPKPEDLHFVPADAASNP